MSVDLLRCRSELLRLVPAVLLLALTACGGGGGGGGGDSPAAATGGTGVTSGQTATTAGAVPALPNNNATITTCPTLPAANTGSAPNAPLKGRVTFDRIPFFPAPPTQYSSSAPGLNYAAPIVAPARGVVVEAVAGTGASCEGSVLDTTLTDGDGWYGLNVPLDQAVCVRARAQLYRSAAGGPGWDISVVDNTDGNRLYAMADSRLASARSLPQRDLHAASGWTAGYTGTRVAAPFAILDTACKSVDAILAVQPAADFGAMTFRWSTRNTESTTGSLTEGKIGGAFFSSGANAVYLRGDAATNTDEFDEMVIAHEFGHFVTHRFSRSDSVGGEHSLNDKLDPTVAFDEAWATAFAGLTLGSHVYRDSDEIATAGLPSREYYFFIDDASAWLGRSWYGEASVQSLIYAFGDTANNDGVSLGFGPIWQVFTGPYKSGDALRTLFSFASALKAANPASATSISGLINNEQISGDTIADFAQTETHAPDTARDLPVYTLLDTAGPQSRCSRNQYASAQTSSDGPNKLSQIRYLRFTPPQPGNYRVTATPVRTDVVKGGLVGLEIYDAGSYFTCGSGSSNIESLEPGRAKALTCPFAAKTYVIAVYQTDFSNDPQAAAGNYDQCFDVKVEPQ